MQKVGMLSVICKLRCINREEADINFMTTFDISVSQIAF